MPLKKLPNGIAVSEIASLVGGRVIGDSNARVLGLAPLSHLTQRSLAFCRDTSSKAIAEAIATPKLGALFIAEAGEKHLPANPAVPLIVVTDPHNALIRSVPLFFEPYPLTAGIHPSASVDPSARIGANVSIAPYVVIGPFVTIGDGAVIHPHVVIYPGATIGARAVLHSHVAVREDVTVGADCVIQNGAILGSDGFGYIPDKAAGLLAVPQIGRATLADRVDVGANACIDRGALGDTELGFGTKVDNLVQIGHNVKIGRFSIVCGQSGIAGSCTLGDQVVLGGGCGVADHISIASGARLAARSAVRSDVPTKGDFAGDPAMPLKAWLRAVVSLRELPNLLRKREARQ